MIMYLLICFRRACITEDSLILTKDGYKEYKDVKVGEYVLTKSNTWQKVAKKFNNGVHKTYYLQGMGFENIHCTANHKFYVREKYIKGHKSIRCFKEPVFKEVKDITQDDYFGVPVIQEEVPFYTDDLDFWYMIGYYMGDGWLTGNGFEIMLACNDTKLLKLKSHLDLTKWGYTVRKSTSCYKFRFANKQAYQFISQYIGTGSSIKRVPGEVLRLPKPQLEALVEGYIDSDGCRIKKNIQFSSINRGLIYAMSLIINKVYNRPTRIYKNEVPPTKTIQGRVVNQHNWYMLRFKVTTDKQDKAFYEDGFIWYPFTKLVEAGDEHVYNMEIENDHSYIVQGCISKNCQDLSLAGLGKGMSANSNTRSSMLWQVGRILDECKELGTLPNILLMENVPQVHGKKNIDDFNMWIKKLEELGYTNDYKDLNAKNYGIPQNRNRCFMISRLNTTEHFEFPTPITLINRLKDLLESSVDEKYYLSDKIVSKLKIKEEVKDRIGIDLNDTRSELRDVSSTIKARYDCGYEHFAPGPTGVAEPTLDKLCNDASNNGFNAVYNEDGISPILLARDYKDPVRVASKEIEQVAQMYPNSGNPQAGRIYNSDGLSPCLDTCMGGNREIKITEEPFIAAIRGRDPENPNCRDKGQHLEQTLEPKFDGTSNTLTTVQKDNYVCEPTCTPLQKEVCNKALEYMQPNDIIDYTYSNSRLEEMNNGYIKTKNSEDNTIMNTLTTNSDNFGVCVEENLKRQLCNKLIEEDKVQEGDIIRHSYTNSRFDSFHIENKDSHDCCATLTTRPDCIGYVENQENKPCPTLDTRCDCLGVVVKDESVIVPEKTKKGYVIAKEGDGIYVNRPEQKRGCVQNGMIQTIKTSVNDLGVVVKDESVYTDTEKQLFTEDGNIKRYINSDQVDEFKEGQMATTSFPNGYGHGLAPMDESITLNTLDKPSVKQNLRIRKLTPKECFRLMGVKDADFINCAENQSNASLYHLAGDSIVAACLMAIFGELFDVDWEQKAVENGLIKSVKTN